MATISSLLADHVTLQVRSVDRIFLAGYVPRLQCDGQLVTFLNQRAGGTIPSPAILGRIGTAYVDQINAFAKANGIPVVRFTKDISPAESPHSWSGERSTDRLEGLRGQGRAGAGPLHPGVRLRPSLP